MYRHWLADKETFTFCCNEAPFLNQAVTEEGSSSCCFLHFLKGKVTRRDAGEVKRCRRGGGGASKLWPRVRLARERGYSLRPGSSLQCQTCLGAICRCDSIAWRVSQFFSLLSEREGERCLRMGFSFFFFFLACLRCKKFLRQFSSYFPPRAGRTSGVLLLFQTNCLHDVFKMKIFFFFGSFHARCFCLYSK